ncbi:MAG: helix-turn-helix transcriptional regulator [Defluviitaleaceae bacterium]|nr:helix-turn-helix transcriptional regulator [Defluviitaleaceae bacterium]
MATRKAVRTMQENPIKQSREDKLRAIREARGISQKALAEALDFGLSSIKRTEGNERQYTDKEVQTALDFMGVKGIPLTANEASTFKGKLYAWRERISNELTEETRNLQKELSVITSVPFEQ